MKSAAGAAALVLAIGFCGLAQAGGLPEVSMKDDPVIYHSPTVWTGFYVGAHIGGAWGDSDFSKGKDGGPKLDVSSDPEGVFGGAQLGYDVQKGQFIYGIVGDLSVSTIDG